MRKILSTSFLALALMAGAANAATILSLTSGTDDSLDSTYNPEDGATGAGNGDSILVADTILEGLLLNGQAKVTFTYLGEEASFNNLFNLVAGNTNLFSNDSLYGATSGPIIMLPDDNGFLPFKFVSNGIGSVVNGAVAGAGALSTIAFKLLSETANTAVYLALFNDAGGPDADYDDMVIRIFAEAVDPVETPPEVPLPAGLLLLLSGLTGLGFIGRSRAKAI